MTESTEVKAAKPKNIANKALVTLDPDQYVTAVFEPFNERLAKAIAGIAGVNYDITTTAGMTTAKECRAIFRAIRIDADKERAARKAPILLISKLLEAKNTEVETAVQPYESRFDTQIKAEEERKEQERAAKIRIEEERKAALKAKIDYIKDAPLRAIDISAAETQAIIDELSILVPTAEFYEERTVEAEIVLESALTQLKSLHTGKVAVEEQQARAEAKRIEDQKREQEQGRVDSIRQRIQAIKNAVIEGSECDASTALQAIIDRVTSMDTTTFAEFNEEAEMTKASTLVSLGRQLKFVKMEEEQASQQEAAAQARVTPVVEQQQDLQVEAAPAAPAEIQHDLQVTAAPAEAAATAAQPSLVGFDLASEEPDNTESATSVPMMYFTGQRPTPAELAQGVARIFGTSTTQAAEWMEYAFGMKQAA